MVSLLRVSWFLFPCRCEHMFFVFSGLKYCRHWCLFYLVSVFWLLSCREISLWYFLGPETRHATDWFCAAFLIGLCIVVVVMSTKHVRMGLSVPAQSPFRTRTSLCVCWFRVSVLDILICLVGSRPCVVENKFDGLDVFAGHPFERFHCGRSWARVRCVHLLFLLQFLCHSLPSFSSSDAIPQTHGPVMCNISTDLKTDFGVGRFIHQNIILGGRFGFRLASALVVKIRKTFIFQSLEVFRCLLVAGTAELNICSAPNRPANLLNIQACRLSKNANRCRLACMALFCAVSCVYTFVRQCHIPLDCALGQSFSDPFCFFRFGNYFALFFAFQRHLNEHLSRLVFPFLKNVLCLFCFVLFHFVRIFLYWFLSTIRFLFCAFLSFFVFLSFCMWTLVIPTCRVTSGPLPKVTSVCFMCFSLLFALRFPICFWIPLRSLSVGRVSSCWGWYLLIAFCFVV